MYLENMINVISIPHVLQLSDSESGIHTVVRNYFKYAQDFGIRFVTTDDAADLIAIHAGMGKPIQTVPIVAHLHGLYWTADYYMPNWAHRSNEHIVELLRHADAVTVPSAWVAETLQRDMHTSPLVLPHGVEWQSWQTDEAKGDYVVGYAKNRAGMDVCNPDFLSELCPRFPDLQFYATFAPNGVQNVRTTGVLPYEQMKRLVQGARVFIQTTKETWGIAMLEAMACGTPVLAYGYGGAAELVEHGVTGYLAAPGSIDDLAQGLQYCYEYADVLGANAREKARQLTWPAAVEKLAKIYQSVLVPKPPTVSVVIPAYNKEAHLEEAVNSVLSQNYPVDKIVIVDNNSTDNTGHIGRSLAELYDSVVYVNEPKQGVAHARNSGISLTDSKYICCLDADDWIDSRFIGTCVHALEQDKSLGIAYTGLTWHRQDGASGNSAWPGKYDYDDQLKRKNQVPTCCVFRRDLWQRTGGYRQRYAPTGAGAEDAELWTRMGALGFRGEKVTDAGLFHYRYGGQVSSNPNYREADWLAWHPWVIDGQHPLASVAKPNRMSHPVRQYDEPTISVIIPVGPGHEEYLTDALDSLEAQTFRKWEVIIVDDTGGLLPESLYQAYPFMRTIRTQGKQGAGFARNRGAEVARAPFLFFLDADDWLDPRCFEYMLKAWGESGEAIYSDYIGIATVGALSGLDEVLRQSVLDRDEKTGRTVLRYRAAPFDCASLIDQPKNPPYLWCNVSTLVEKRWHDAIGGFDESMTSWEDVDYWYRMAWSGVCFYRVAEPLLVYRFNTGQRREAGRREWDRLIAHIAGKRPK